MTLRLLCALLCALAPLAHAQVTGTFSYVSPDTAPVGVVSGGTITIPAVAVNQTSSVTLIATNSSTKAWQITDTTLPTAPFKSSTPSGTLAPGASMPITLSFSPTKGGTSSSTFAFTVTTVPQANTPQENGSFLFILRGTGLAPDFVPSYILNPGGNQLPLLDQGTIAFNPIGVNQTATATIILSNAGNGNGVVSVVTLTGVGFQLTGLPLVPATVAPQQDVRFTIVFSPKASTTYQGSLRVVMDGTTRTVSLTGAGQSAQLVYEALPASGTVALAPNGSLAMGDTTVGGTVTVPVRIRNAGTGDGLVTAIRVSAAGGAATPFSLASVPPLPATLAVGQSLTFNLVFKPTEVGSADAQLVMDNVVVNLTGTGIGSRLTLTIDPGNGAVTIPAGGNIQFSNTAVGSNSSVTVKVANSGNARLTVSSVTVSGSVFTLKGVPGLPASLEPGQSISFSAVFTPTAIPAVTGALQVDDLNFVLRGAGAAPPALPAISFQAVPARLASLQQPAIGLKLVQAYPLDLSGTLTLGFTSSVFGDDSAIQFASGGRTVTFRIPANSTDAVFGQSGTTVSFQSGTVAGIINVAATLSTGSVDVTPQPGPLVTIPVTGGAPVVRAVQVGNRTTAGFELLITGYSNMRSVTRLSFSFTGAAGANLTTSTLDVDTDAAFGAWYQTATSWTFGSQFTASVFINVNGRQDDVQSVAVTAANSLGVSPPASVNLR